MKVCFYTLGCKVNSYESSAIMNALMEKGFVEVPNDSEADVCIINTCSVTNTADQKSRQRIHNAIKKHPQSVIAVTGCYAQVKSKEVSEIEGVDIVVGNSKKGEIVPLILECLKGKKKFLEVDDIMKCHQYENLEAIEFEHTRAFLKIQDGCNNFCTYCLIPFARGPLRSKKHELVLEEVEKICQMGYKEIVLAGIHTGGYVDGEVTFSMLTKMILNNQNLLRLRVSSMEITQVDGLFLTLLKENPHLANHLHLPLQSGSDGVLKRMNRKYNKAEYLTIINSIRNVRKDIAIATDLIVGFPGETDLEFEETLSFLKEIGYAKIHVFPYSKRDGTKASLFQNQITDAVKEQRVKQVLALSDELELFYASQFIGQTMEVIPEVEKDGYLGGHTSNYLYVTFQGNSSLIGKNVLVKINDVKKEKNLAKIKKDSLQIEGSLV